MDPDVEEAQHARGRRPGDAAADLQKDGRHFSYFAFEGGRGTLRWQHEPEDFHRDLGALHDELVAEHGFHGEAQAAAARHYGEVSCREYRESVLAALPHSWHAARDTRLQLSHFHRHSEARGAQREVIPKLGAQLQSGGRAGAAAFKDATGAVRSLLSPFWRSDMDKDGTIVSPSPATKKASRHSLPNVLVAHLEDGIEAVHLYSGRTVCALHLASPGLHVDLDGDGVPDHVTAWGGDPASLALEAAREDADVRHRHARAGTFCFAAVSSGIPPRHHLFNGTICRAFYGLRMRHRVGPVEVAPPVMLPVPGRRGGYRPSGIGQRGMAVFLNSRGELTAYSHGGELLWQVFAGVGWRTQRRAEEEDDEDSAEGNPNKFEPTLVPVALHTRAVPTTILAGGFVGSGACRAFLCFWGIRTISADLTVVLSPLQTLNLISLSFFLSSLHAAGTNSATFVSEHGRELETIDLPEAPSQPLVIADFNFDRYNDVIEISDSGIYAWAQVR
jgi:hypothetical protein